MKIKTILILLGSLLILQNCAPPAIKITAVTDSNHKIYLDGAVTSEKKHAVSISHYKNFKRVKSNTLFEIVIENRCEKPLLINKDNISVIFEGNDIGWESKKISVQPLYELRRDIGDDYFYEEARILIKTLHIASAGMLKHWEVPDIVRKLKKRRLEKSAALDVLTELFLKPQLIKPHKSIMGIVACDTSKLPKDMDGHFQVVLTIDGEEHDFTFFRKGI